MYRTVVNDVVIVGVFFDGQIVRMIEDAAGEAWLTIAAKALPGSDQRRGLICADRLRPLVRRFLGCRLCWKRLYADR